MIEARDLEKKDIGFLKKGSADPFVVVKSELYYTIYVFKTYNIPRYLWSTQSTRPVILIESIVNDVEGELQDTMQLTLVSLYYLFTIPTRTSIVHGPHQS